MKWLIIGTGWISEKFITSLKSNGQIPFGIYSRTKEKGDAFASKNNIEKVITSLKDLGEYDAVYIGSPNSIHYGQAVEVIEQGIDLMIEKPMTHSFELTKELFELADSKGVKLMEAYAHITNPEFHNLKGTELQVNFMQLSSKIKNGTFATASSFSKELFGGVIPDLGVYSISLAILTLGKVLDATISNKEKLNGVIVACDIELKQEKGNSRFRISKTEDGDNKVYLDGRVVLPKVSAIQENRMDAEIKVFLEGTKLKFYRSISVETARVVELLLNK